MQGNTGLYIIIPLLTTGDGTIFQDIEVLIQFIASATTNQYLQVCSNFRFDGTAFLQLPGISLSSNPSTLSYLLPF